MKTKKDLKKEIKLFYEGDAKKFPNDIPKKIRMSLLKNLGFFEKMDKKLQKFKLNNDVGMNVKKAYPNFDGNNIPYEEPADLGKWINTAKNIDYYRENNYQNAFEHATSGWNDMEKLKFTNWLKFYEGGNHKKYATANVYFGGSGEIGYVLPNPSNKKDELNVIDDLNSKDLTPEQKKHIIEKQRKKIIGRLDSTEKLLRSEDGRHFVGEELSELIKIIHELKRKIYSINKKSSSNKIYDDMIIREANILIKNGFVDAAAVLYKIADEAININDNSLMALGQQPLPPVNEPSTPSPAPSPITPTPPSQTPQPSQNKPIPTSPGAALSPAPPGSTTVGGGAPNTSPTQPLNPSEPSPSAGSGPSISGGPPTIPPPENTPTPTTSLPSSSSNLPGEATPSQKPQESPAWKQFFDEMNKNNTKKQASFFDDDEELIVEAQVAPNVGNAPLEIESPAPISMPQPTKEPLEVKENDRVPMLSYNKSKDFDAIIDSAFQNVTIADIVNKLEDLTNLFKNREIPRQLAIVDLMLDRVGLSSVFSELSEASGKSIEANNYILSRIEDILSKLRGSVGVSKIDLQQTTAPSGEAQVIKEKIELDKAKDEKRKQLRKEMENQQFETAPQPPPPVEMKEDLNQPIIAPTQNPNI